MKKYKIEKIKLDAEGYFCENRTVLRNGKKGKYGFITLPVWLIGDKFDVFLVQKEKEEPLENKTEPNEIIEEEINRDLGKDESILQ